MGIDVYLCYVGMKADERAAQITGFQIDAGNVGYLREAYSGSPFATQVLVPEGFDDDKCIKDEGAEDYNGVRIPAATLRERLPIAEATCKERYRGYPSGEVAAKSFADFVALAERWEAEGKDVFVYVSY